MTEWKVGERPVRELPHCPAPLREHAGAFDAEVCGCPRDGAYGRPVHWITRDGRAVYCGCGPTLPLLHKTSGDPILDAVSGGRACRSCASGLLARHFVQRLGVSARCCYCGDPAEARSGWSLKGHPALGVPGARR